MKLTNAVQQWERSKGINDPAKQYMKVSDSEVANRGGRK